MTRHSMTVSDSPDSLNHLEWTTNGDFDDDETCSFVTATTSFEERTYNPVPARACPAPFRPDFMPTTRDKIITPDSQWWHDFTYESYDVNPDEMRLRRANIETTIYCCICNRHLPRCHFSEVQQARYDPKPSDPWWVYKKNNSKAVRFKPTCLACTASPATHILCADCRRIKVKEEFSKVQRKRHLPRCSRCVEKGLRTWEELLDRGNQEIDTQMHAPERNRPVITVGLDDDFFDEDSFWDEDEDDGALMDVVN